jgi:hypothetical protein
MSGLLDFIKTPEGQGLLSAVAGGLAGARRGTPLNNIGRGGLAGLAGYSGALDRQGMEGDRAFQQQQRQMQMDEMKRKQAEAQAQQQWRSGLPGVMKQMEPTYGAGEEGPTMTPGNPNAVNDYLMRPESPFLDDLLKQQLFPKAEDYRVVGGDLVKIGKGGITVAHQSQRPDNLPSEQKLYNLAVEQGYKGDFMSFIRDRVSNTEGAKAAFDVMPVTRPDGTTSLMPRSAVATQAGGGVRPSGNFSGSGYAGGSAGAAASDQRAILTRELEAARQRGNPEDVAGLERELARLPGGVVPGMQVQSKAQEAAAVAAATDAATGKARERESAKEASAASIDAQIGVIDKALNHPGRKTATGLSGMIDPRNYTPGTNARDFQVVLDQLGGAAFLQAFESLKGGGQITEIEGKKATDAMARLNRAQSDKEFEASLRDLREVMEKGRQRIKGQSAPDAQPKPTMRFNPATGKLEQVR